VIIAIIALLFSYLVLIAKEIFNIPYVLKFLGVNSKNYIKIVDIPLFFWGTLLFTLDLPRN